jgi:RNA polymerase alpha subunit
MQSYCDFFKTIHDETIPTGYLGQGTHYSVLRAMVFHDPFGIPMSEGQFADFAVIWDSDHDVRVMKTIEEIFRRGLLSSFVIFGERKGIFTAILSDTIRSSAPKLPFNPLLLQKVEKLPLSIRSENCLKNGNIIYVGDLVQMGEAEILCTPNFGRKSLNEIKEVLVKMGLSLGMEVPNWPPQNVEMLSINGASEEHRVAFLNAEIDKICQSLDDPWHSVVTALDNSDNPIIDDECDKVRLYLKNIEMLWRLGVTTTGKSHADDVGIDDLPDLMPSPSRYTRDGLLRV